MSPGRNSRPFSSTLNPSTPILFILHAIITLSKRAYSSKHQPCNNYTYGSLLHAHCNSSTYGSLLNSVTLVMTLVMANMLQTHSSIIEIPTKASIVCWYWLQTTWHALPCPAKQRNCIQQQLYKNIPTPTSMVTAPLNSNLTQSYSGIFTRIRMSKGQGLDANQQPQGMRPPLPDSYSYSLQHNLDLQE